MTPDIPQRFCVVESCNEGDCPHRHEREETEWDETGLFIHYPYCYIAKKKIPEQIGTEGYELFPDWCPLESRPLPAQPAPADVLELLDERSRNNSFNVEDKSGDIHAEIGRASCRERV